MLLALMALPGARKLKDNELVLFDLGVVAEGYTSDVTRTFAFGEISSEAASIYDVVLKAQEKAQAACKTRYYNWRIR